MANSLSLRVTRLFVFVWFIFTPEGFILHKQIDRKEFKSILCLLFMLLPFFKDIFSQSLVAFIIKGSRIQLCIFFFSAFSLNILFLFFFVMCV